ncbi:hypothetical protein ACWD0A_09340 [Streptomyces sp. NPDC002867]
MNRTEGRAVDRADNKGSQKVYDYGTGKAPISGDTAVPDGSKAHNSPLHREFDPAKRDANRAVVCPDSGQYALVLHPLATGDKKATQCDEYAFAASKESGGSQAGVTNGSQCLQAYAREDADGKWRLCDDLRAPNTAPTYKEKCARATMAGARNERAGSRLSGFYTKNRMLDNDAYFIDVPGLVRP